MDEMIRQGAVEGFNNGMRNVGNNAAAQNIGGTAEMIAVDEEIRDLDTSIDKLKGNLKASKIVCIILGVVIVVVFVARLLV